MGVGGCGRKRSRGAGRCGDSWLQDGAVSLWVGESGERAERVLRGNATMTWSIREKLCPADRSAGPMRDARPCASDARVRCY